MLGSRELSAYPDALFMKLLASEIVAFFHKLPTPLERMIQAGTSNKLRVELEELEAGSIFRHLNIKNFLEGDLFAWYTAVWSEPIEKLVRDMVVRLDNYNPGTLSEDPVGSRDLLKKLYQQLFPKTVRHDLGEYYTPDWLAEHVLNELEYVGDPDKRLLDPACGSGTFLVMAIKRIGAWYEENLEAARFGRDDLCRKILDNVAGFDLNPLAVMAARTNYLIAIRDLIGLVDKVEIPIYLCDSILTPSEYGGLFSGKLGSSRNLQTAATTFIVPAEVTGNRAHLAKYAEQLEFCVQNQYTPEEFLQRCQDEDLPTTARTLHTDLYEDLVRLKEQNKNSVWARIIKNAFAPLFIQDADYIVGNPPWINWEALPLNYREDSRHLWVDYDLLPEKGQLQKMRGGKKDLSTLFVHTAADNYLKEQGHLGFVITQSIFKGGGASSGFRRFRLRDRYLEVLGVDDMSLIKPFEGAVNRTAVLICRKSTKATTYPVPYRLWRSTVKESIEQYGDYADVMSVMEQLKLAAKPALSNDPQSGWMTAEEEILPAISKVMGNAA